MCICTLYFIYGLIWDVVVGSIVVQCKKTTLINRILFLFFLPSFRLLDITHGQRRDREMSLHLIFEHIHGDLASYLEKCPPPGLEPDRIKVCVLTRFTISGFVAWWKCPPRILQNPKVFISSNGKTKTVYQKMMQILSHFHWAQALKFVRCVSLFFFKKWKSEGLLI